MKKGFAVLVIWKDGSEDYLCQDVSDRIVKFTTRKCAEVKRDFLLEGISDEVQSVNVVPFPKR